MNEQEMARLFTGKDNWTTNDAPDHHLPSIRMADGPNGLRIEQYAGLGFPESYPATLYPTASLSACSFDRNLQYELGEHLGQECIEQGVQVLLGPGINHKRSPLCGRNFEYYSEDPYLSGQLASAYVNGVQDQGVGTSLKHFAGNSREYGRMVSDSIIDERALHELYLSQFETVVRQSRPWSLMLAYNKLNGVYCCQNKELMDTARNRWGFDGLFVSDWGGVADPAASFAAGLNLEMPGGSLGSDRRILDALQQGTIDRKQLDFNTEVLFHLAERVSNPKKKQGTDPLAFAQKLAEESCVLLKNEGVLPLCKNKSVALIGSFACTPRNQGSGSSKVNVSFSDSIYEAMKEDRMPFAYAPGFSVETDAIDPVLETQALDLAERSSLVVVIAGVPFGNEAELMDRRHMRLPENQNHLIQALPQANPNIIVVLQCGAPVELPWINDVKGILCTYLSGAKGGRATVNLLQGTVNPSGKLAETWPLKLEDTPCADSFNEHLLQVQYRESIFSGYRYYEAAKVKPLFAFGYGLSYTSFSYSNLRIDSSEETILVKADITNTGDTAGKEIVQLYVGKHDTVIARAPKELRGFEKVELEPGETKTVQFVLDQRSFAYYDVEAHDWLVEESSYQIMIASSSDDVRLTASLFRHGTVKPFSRIPKDYVDQAVKNGGFQTSLFEEVLGHKIKEPEIQRPFTASTSILELQETGMGKLIRRGMELAKGKIDMDDVTEEMIMEVPIRMIKMLSDRISWDTVDAAVNLVNGKGTVFHVLKTIRRKES